MSALLADSERKVAGTIKLCYLDPPYNTGERFEPYDDRVDRAEWLTTLRDHLRAARQLLAPDGSLWLHLDDSEQHRARCVLDEIFGEEFLRSHDRLAEAHHSRQPQSFSSMHDYIHVYAPAGPKAWKMMRNGLPDEGAFSNPDQDPRGPWRLVPMNVQAGHATASQPKASWPHGTDGRDRHRPRHWLRAGPNLSWACALVAQSGLSPGAVEGAGQQAETNGERRRGVRNPAAPDSGGDGAVAVGGAALPVTWVCSVPHQHVNVTTMPASVLASDVTWLGKMSTRLAHTWQLLSNIVDPP